jgi:CheY-like chemotaxis protein
MPTSVLIVDDDLVFGRAAAEMLADRGYCVLAHVTTAAEALAKCKKLDPDAVLLDVRLPDGDGVTLAERLRAGLDRPRILLTSTDRKAVSPASLSQSGAAGFVPKAELALCDLDDFLKP